MPTSPPPERRYSTASNTGFSIFVVIAALVLIVVAPVAMSLEQRKDREARQWEELRTVYQAGRLGTCEGRVDPRIGEVCAKLTDAESDR